MINLIDNQDLYFGGNKLDKGAYVEVKVLGSVDTGASDKMTAKLCEILEKELGIPSNAVYISYWGTSNLSVGQQSQHNLKIVPSSSSLQLFTKNLFNCFFLLEFLSFLFV